MTRIRSPGKIPGLRGEALSSVHASRLPTSDDGRSSDIREKGRSRDGGGDEILRAFSGIALQYITSHGCTLQKTYTLQHLQFRSAGDNDLPISSRTIDLSLSRDKSSFLLRAGTFVTCKCLFHEESCYFSLDGGTSGRV